MKLQLYCPICKRQLDVIFSEEYQVFLSDRQYVLGTIFEDGQHRKWQITHIAEHWSGWKHSIELVDNEKNLS